MSGNEEDKETGKMTDPDKKNVDRTIDRPIARKVLIPVADSEPLDRASIVMEAASRETHDAAAPKIELHRGKNAESVREPGFFDRDECETPVVADKPAQSPEAGRLDPRGPSVPGPPARRACARAARARAPGGPWREFPAGRRGGYRSARAAVGAGGARLRSPRRALFVIRATPAGPQLTARVPVTMQNPRTRRMEEVSADDGGILMRSSVAYQVGDM